MFRLIFSLLAISAFSKYSESARILASVFSPSYSHQIAFRPLWKELSEKGHQIVLLTTDPAKDNGLKNLIEIDLSKSYEIMAQYNTTDILSRKEGNPLKLIRTFMEALSATAKWQLEHPDVQKLIKNKTEHFDLLMVEVAYPTHMAFAERFNVPFIGLTSLDATRRIHETVGNSIHPVLNPDVILPYTGDLTFTQRVFSVVVYIASKLYEEYYLYPSEDETVKTIFGKGMSTLFEIQRRMDLLFININPIFHNIRAIGPNTIPIGGGTHFDASKSKALPKDIKTFLDSAKNGFIYLSFGSNVKSKALKPSTRNNIVAALKELPYKVLWKFEDEQLSDKPENVMIQTWVPQQDVFKHPNVKLFITQCGLQSMEEAILNHIPMVGIPFFGDQPFNAEVLENRGLGIKLDHNNFTKFDLKEAIIEVITNPMYKKKIVEIADLTTDVEMTGMEKAVWWTEYVIRHKGAKHFRSPAVDLPFYQYFLLDVIAFVSTILLIVIWGSIQITKVIIKTLLSKIVAKAKVD